MGPLYPDLHYMDDPAHVGYPQLWHPDYGWGVVVNVHADSYDVSFESQWELDHVPGIADCDERMFSISMGANLPETCTWRNMANFRDRLETAKALDARK